MRIWTYVNIKGQGNSLTLVQGHSYSTFSNFFSLEIVRPNEAKIHMEPPWDSGMKVCSNGLGHMTKMASMLIYGKNQKKKKKKIFFSGTKRPMTLKVGMHYWVLKYYQVYSNDDPGLTLTYFAARSNLASYPFLWRSGWGGGVLEFSNL